MFTGLVEALGTVRAVAPDGAGRKLAIAEPRLAGDLAIGESIAINGVCLTVVERGDGISLTLVEVTTSGFSIALIPHTLDMTTLGFKQPTTTVNLETDLFAKYVWKCLETINLTDK